MLNVINVHGLSLFKQRSGESELLQFADHGSQPAWWRKSFVRADSGATPQRIQREPTGQQLVEGPAWGTVGAGAGREQGEGPFEVWVGGSDGHGAVWPVVLKDAESAARNWRPGNAYPGRGSTGRILFRSKIGWRSAGKLLLPSHTLCIRVATSLNYDDAIG